jgi:methyltransferase (TIGR00027 family)
MRTGEESQTAVLVCSGRAAAHGRTPVAAFADPTAEVLLPPDAQARVRAYRAGEPAPRGAAGLEQSMLRATSALMVPRTVAVDDAIRAAPPPQLVILGAGLDGRAWRLPELSGTTVYEVDHPASQQAKRSRAAALTPTAGEIRFVPVDFTVDDLNARLAEAGHAPEVPTAWLWEGVVPYLTRPQIEATLGVVAARSAPGSRLIVVYNAPGLGRLAGRLLFRAMSRAGGRDILADEPQRSFFRPPQLRAMLQPHGFTVDTDRDVVTIAGTLGADVRAMGPFAKANRIAIATKR